MSHPVGQRALRWAPVVPLAAALVIHSRWFGFISDDAYISFVYSRNFAEHNQLVFNLGERVEGYTNFLWTLLLGLAMKVGISPETGSIVFGLIFAVGTLVASARLMAKLRGRETLWDFLPGALLVASSGYACWTSGGLETQMFTFLVILGIALWFEDRFWGAGVALALASMTRPEGALVYLMLWIHRRVMLAIAERRFLPSGDELLGLAAFLGLYAPYFVWRWWYYGWLFPNTYYVKSGGGQVSPQFKKAVLENGLFYVWQWARQSRALFVAPLAALAVWRHPRFGSYVLALTAVFLVYVVKIGGDFMGLHRFVMPLFVTTALLAALALASIPRGVSLVPVVLGLFIWSQVSLSRLSMKPVADHGIDRPGYLKVYAHDRGLIGKALAPHIRPDDFSIVGGAGVQPYYGRLRGIDVFGLVSEDFAHHVTPNNPRPGHSKWAPASLVLKYNPTFVFACYKLSTDPSGARTNWRCGDAGIYQARGYEPVTIFVPGLQESGEYYTFLKRKDRPWP